MFLATTAFAQDKLSYAEFLKLAQSQNLDLKIEQAKLDGVKANARAISIPPPMVGAMRMTDQSGSSANGIEVSQMIPFPTKLTNDHSARDYELKAQQESRKISESEIRAKARLIYLDLWLSQQRREALQEKKRVIENHIKLARAGARSDSFQRIHVLKAESDLDLLENEILALDQNVHEKELAMAIFLNNTNGDQFHPSLETLPVSEIPKKNSNPPQIEMAKYTLESFKARESEAKSSWFPDLYLRYKQIGQTEMMPKTTEMMVGISLPFIFPWDTSSQSGKASAQRLQAELEYEKEKRKTDFNLSSLFTKATSLKKQLDNLTQKLLPRAEKRMNLVHNVAPRDMETLQDHRETMEVFPELKLKALDLREQYEQVIAEIEKYSTGVSNAEKAE